MIERSAVVVCQMMKSIAILNEFLQHGPPTSSDQLFLFVHITSLIIFVSPTASQLLSSAGKQTELKL
jgi:hypothetical protein